MDPYRLIAALGTTPAVLTETVWSLARPEPGRSARLPTDVLILTTTVGAASVTEALFTPPADGGRSVWDTLCLDELGLPAPIPYRIEVAEDAAGIPLDDIRDREADLRFGALCYEHVRQRTAPRRHAILMQLVHLGVAQADNQLRSRRVKEGMRRAMREGRFVNRTPLGYRSVRDEKRKPLLVPDDERAPHVREAFELVAAGHIASEEVRRRLWTRGLRIGRSKFTELLRNVVYVGQVRIPAWQGEPEETVLGLHEPLVSVDLFERVQAVLSGRRGPRAGTSSARRAAAS